MAWQTEEEKLREQIPMSDEMLATWLTVRNIPFDLDGNGTPWLSHATLQFVADEISHLQSIK